MKVRRFETLNSVYEVDELERRIRRLRGKNEPTERFTPDGEWKTFAALRPYFDGRVVIWPDGGYTFLSKVVKGA